MIKFLIKKLRNPVTVLRKTKLSCMRGPVGLIDAAVPLLDGVPGAAPALPELWFDEKGWNQEWQSVNSRVNPFPSPESLYGRVNSRVNLFPIIHGVTPELTLASSTIRFAFVKEHNLPV